MIDDLNCKSIKTKERIELINIKIDEHKQNISLLRYAFCRFVEMKENCFLPRKVRYSSIPKQESIYKYTLHNLQFQISLLEKERDVLLEFGA